MTQQTQAQETIVRWALAHDLRASEKACCPHWLLRGRSTRCRRQEQCTHYGSFTASDRGWLDHTTSWLRGGRPAAIASAPYQVTDGDEARITGWLERHPELRTARGTGWHGHGTTQIVLWNSERCGPLAAAEPAGPAAAHT